MAFQSLRDARGKSLVSYANSPEYTATTHGTFMLAPLQLEYVLTDVEIKKAHALHRRVSSSEKSKWRSRAIQLCFMAAFLCLCYFRIRHEVAPKYQPWFLLGAAGLILLFHFGTRNLFSKEKLAVKLEVAESEIIFREQIGCTTLIWSALGDCLESAELFVLVNRDASLLYAIPKSAFPDVASQDWFRTLVKQKLADVAKMVDEPVKSQQLLENGLALQFQFRFSDYLVRNISSWRMKGLAMLMYGLIGFTTLNQYLHPGLGDVNGPGTVLLIMLSIVTSILIFVLLLVSYLWWRMERKQNRDGYKLVLSEEGINFLNLRESGLVKWNAYESYLENRWCFIMWNQKRRTSFLLPKRAFASQAALAQCREILRSNITVSRRFFL